MKPKRKKGISNAQRITLIARTAWTQLEGNGAIDEPFDAWRQREAIALVGCRISKATKAQLDRLETHFLALGGNTGKAFDQATGESNETKQQRHVIKTLASQLGLPPFYAAKLPPRQLRGVIINLTKRVRAAQKNPHDHE